MSPQANSERYYGKIKSYDHEKGWGFIACPKSFDVYGADVYLHIKALEFCRINPKLIHPGVGVGFDVYVSQRGQAQANNIEVLDSGYGDGGGKQGSKSGSKGYSGGKGADKGSSKGGKTSSQSSRGGYEADSRPSSAKARPAVKGASRGYEQGGYDRGGYDKGKGARSDSWTGGKAQASQTSNRRVLVKESSVMTALKEVVGEAACAKVLTECGGDGSPMVAVSLSTLNALLKVAGGNVVEGSEDVPDEKEALPGYDGGKVAGPWFTGTLKEYKADQAYGLIDCDAFKEQFGDKELFIHADHLDPDGTGELLVPEGEEVIFPLVEDEEGNAWAWAPIIPKNKNFRGIVKQWGSTHGYLTCETLWPVFEEDIYCHGNAAEFGGCKTEVGTPIVFNLHVSKQGKPQASSPRPPGLMSNALPGGNFSMPKPKKRKLEHDISVHSPLDPDRIYRGTVKSYDPTKGFGFIDCEETLDVYERDVFLHRTLIEHSGFEVGNAVAFKIMLNSQNQPQATVLFRPEDR